MRSRSTLLECGRFPRAAPRDKSVGLRVACALLVSFWVLSACSSEARLRKAGLTPFVSCLVGPEPDARTIRTGELELEIRERELTVRGPARPLRVAAFSAAALGGTLGTSTLERLRQSQADLFILLGGVGDQPQPAAATLARLASLSSPTLAVLGGRDGWAAREKALEELKNAERIIDATVLRAVRIGRHTLVPLAGAEAGRYALGGAACGFDAADLDQVAEELGAAKSDETRWLLSWQAPSDLGPQLGPRTSFGLPLGSERVAAFARRISARGVLYAWPPDDRVAPATPFELGVTGLPRLFGPRVEAGDGTRAALAALVLEFDPRSPGARAVAVY
jgi:hypothetical protein